MVARRVFSDEMELVVVLPGTVQRSPSRLMKRNLYIE